MSPRPVIATGQQIGAGWSPALSIAKALAALAEARRTGAEAVYWLADEDHDHAEVASVVGWDGSRLVRHRFRFDTRPGTATGWLPWSPQHQAEATKLWGPLPEPEAPTLRGHVLALGRPLWERGLRPFSPTNPEVRDPIQAELERWRSLDLQAGLVQQADRLIAQGAPLPLDPRVQAAWFSLDPGTGRRQRLEPGEVLAKGLWLSPGAAIRPLMQSLLLPVAAVVLGPSERAYWRLCEPLWDRVGLPAPRILPRPSVFVMPSGYRIAPDQMDALRLGAWDNLGPWAGVFPTGMVQEIQPDSAWPMAIQERFRREQARSRERLGKLDRRLHREAAGRMLGGDPEFLRQTLFPFGRPQERVIPGLPWLRSGALLDAILDRMDGTRPVILVEEP
ncbi:MAG: bacillithiol biosynthesis BshC [Geothrix sp.]|uniref:bacillithiol biosynthesis protein BshC n=1 Tax=Geothrix sp. TaxID=1962974 RepID=UPI0017FA5364|nr:bacillithiol biosynthesis BshC [Geothrix sp.]NWJ39720.1 bacillithiol biosynthesis BshC [Geothrix sp.]WIL22263.1 MAG: bacillithiol biosynthesis BshC [Geothrix sp.]